jgi:hypothetical protein
MTKTRLHLLVPLLATALVAAAGCSNPKSGVSDSITSQYQQSKGDNVDLAVANPADWDRVCIIGPRAGEKVLRIALGFEWNAAQRTNINTNDGIALLIFVKGNQVEEFAEHPRTLGDFATLSGQCYARDKARFYQAHASQTRPAGMYPKSET